MECCSHPCYSCAPCVFSGIRYLASAGRCWPSWARRFCVGGLQWALCWYCPSWCPPAGTTWVCPHCTRLPSSPGSSSPFPFSGQNTPHNPFTRTHRTSPSHTEHHTQNITITHRTSHTEHPHHTQNITITHRTSHTEHHTQNITITHRTSPSHTDWVSGEADCSRLPQGFSHLSDNINIVTFCANQSETVFSGLKACLVNDTNNNKRLLNLTVLLFWFNLCAFVAFLFLCFASIHNFFVLF